MKNTHPPSNIIAAVYGMLAYLLGLASILYLIGFVDDAFVPKSIDRGGSAGVGTFAAVVVDSLLLALFALQHSIMARPGFKSVWTRVVPAQIERSTYVLFSAAVLGLLMWQWRPIEGTVWQFGRSGSLAMIALGCLGWSLLFLSTFLIDHCELFGLRQTFARLLRLRDDQPTFRTPFLYRIVRHPLYLGIVLAMWAAPTMTPGHLLFASLMTAYIVFAISLEESDLIDVFGDSYVRYRRKVGMLFPRLWRSRPGT
jgi:protein-S-isoprenylcysteine O-methyltransferase Ste14